MTNESVLVWLDGQILTLENAKVSPLSQTLQYGFGVYEGLRCYQTSQGGAIFRLVDHTNRLFESAKILKLTVPYSKDQLISAQHQLVSQFENKDLYLRPCVFLSDKSFGLSSINNDKSHVMIAAIPWKNKFMDESKYKDGIDVQVSSYQTHVPRIGINKVKCNGKYYLSIMANNQAHSDGYDDAILLDHNGFVAEGTGANLFIVKNKELITPKTTSALDGITRQSIITFADKLKIKVKEADILREDLYCADELFFCGTAAEVLPIKSVDRNCIGDGKRGVITEQIQSLYNQIIRGKHTQYYNWLSLVNHSEIQFQKSGVAEHGRKTIS